MPAHGPRRLATGLLQRAASRLSAAWILVLSAGCGGDGDLERARVHLAQHRLEAAEAELEGGRGAGFEQLQARLSALRSARAERLAELDARAEAEAPDVLRMVLREAARGDSDPVVREHASRLLSGLSDHLARARSEELAQAIRPRKDPAGEPDPGATGAPGGLGADPVPPPQLRRSLARIPGAELGEPEDSAPAQEPIAARPGATGVLPADGPRTPGAPAAGASQKAELGAFSPQAALELERAGLLTEARAVWIELAFAAEPGPLRTDRVARARSLERRVLLRSELAAAIAAAPERFAADGFDQPDALGLVVGGERRTWGELEGNLLLRLANRATLSQEARLGLVLERLARGKSPDATAALAELARLLERAEIEQAEAFAILADFRGEVLPEGGYVHSKGTWVTRAAHEETLLAARIADLAARLQRAQGATRDVLVGDLVAVGEPARAALAGGLEERLAQSAQTLAKGNTLAALERLAESRRELDRRRAQALDLIFDEEVYFYPFNGPDIPAGKKAGDYWPVQRQVDELVARVDEVWRAASAVRLPTAFRGALGDLGWALETAQALELALLPPPGLPDWISGLPALEEVDLATFAWDAGERERLAYDRAVLAYNERQWAAWARRDEDRAPRGEERRQVSVTNEYRRMLGRRLLAWNPDIQLAARWHSVYMADTGDFGHTQPDPERRTPFDRMRLAGYDHGASENCHMGSGSAEGAHQGWRRSSGHHRNLLAADHREMASALASVYWTQNFGRGTQFLGELEGWHD